MTSSKIGKKLTAYCSTCRGDRNCKIHGNYREGSSDGHYEWYRDWYLLTCCGCNHVFAQSISTNSEDLDYDYDDDGNTISLPIETIVMWPAKAKRERPSWFDGGRIDSEESTFELDALLRELYGALDHDLNVFASIGMRTAFDVAAESLGVDPHSPFNAKITKLVEDGCIKASESDRISIVVDSGSASAHRGWQPQINELDTLMQILEDFIFNNFVAPSREKAKLERLAKIKEKVPQKSKRIDTRKRAVIKV